MTQLSNPEANLTITMGPDNQTRFEASGDHEQIAQMLALLQGNQSAAVTAQQSIEHAEVKGGPSKSETFIARRAGALMLAGACAFSGAVSYSVASGHNLFKHPSEFSRPVHDVERIIHILRAL